MLEGSEQYVYMFVMSQNNVGKLVLANLFLRDRFFRRSDDRPSLKKKG